MFLGVSLDDSNAPPLTPPSLLFEQFSSPHSLCTDFLVSSRLDVKWSVLNACECSFDIHMRLMLAFSEKVWRWTWKSAKSPLESYWFHKCTDQMIRWGLRSCFLCQLMDRLLALLAEFLSFQFCQVWKSAVGAIFTITCERDEAAIFNHRDNNKQYRGRTSTLRQRKGRHPPPNDHVMDGRGAGQPVEGSASGGVSQWGG